MLNSTNYQSLCSLMGDKGQGTKDYNPIVRASKQGIQKLEDCLSEKELR